MKKEILVRTLPPVEGEILSSWVARLAAANQLPLVEVLRRLGYEYTKHVLRPSGYNLVLQDDILDQMRRVTYIEPQIVRALVLDQYRNSPLMMEGTQFGYLSRLVAALNWVDLRGSAYCPMCLREDGGAWQAHWRFPWIYGCLRHRRLMHATCPRCLKPPNSGRRQGIPGSTFPSWVPSPTCCGNPAERKSRQSGRASRPCGQDLLEVEAGAPLTVDDEDTLVFLRSRMAVPNAPDGLRVWWNDLRAICSALLAVGERDTLRIVLQRQMPPTSEAAWTQWMSERAALEAHAVADFHHPPQPPQSPTTRRKMHARLHTWHHAPANPPLMQGLVSAALAILNEPDPGALDRAYLNSRRHHTGNRWLPLRLREAGVSPTLSQRIHDAVVRARRNRPPEPCTCKDKRPSRI